MVEHLSSPVARYVSWTLLHFLWQGLLLGLAYWTLLATTAVRSARVRYATSLLTLTLMALCPVITFAMLYHSDSVAETAPQHLASASLTSLRDVRPPATFTYEIASSSNRAADLQPVLATSDSSPLRNRAVGLLQSAAETSQPYVLLLWLAGMLLSGARLTAGYLNVVWLRAGRIAISAELEDRSLILARWLGLKTARVFASERIREAAVVGFWNPVVLLPASWLTELPPDVLEAVIAHELAHIRRFDVWVNLLQRILETLLFYHPMVWWLSNRIRQERELCCDELAVHATGKRGDYAIALEYVGRLQFQGTLRLATTFTGDGKMKLLSRIQHVLGTARTPDREPSWLVGIV
ncbi:MAG: M56 family metallopeptidase, partial [Planctomycetota bacterium]